MDFYKIHKIGWCVSTVFISYSTYNYNKMNFFGKFDEYKISNQYTNGLLTISSSCLYSIGWPIMLPISIGMFFDKKLNK